MNQISDTKSRILEDSHIRLTGYKSSRLYPDNMRFIRVYDPDNDDIIDLISNNFEVGATEIIRILNIPKTILDTNRSASRIVNSIDISMPLCIGIT